jgi:hypothetical protein
LTRKARIDKSVFDTVAVTNVEDPMYRIIKRIVHTVTTVTWLVRWEDSSLDGKSIEKEITFPASYSVAEEEISETNHLPIQTTEKSQPILDKGEKT